MWISGRKRIQMFISAFSGPMLFLLLGLIRAIITMYLCVNVNSTE